MLSLIYHKENEREKQRKLLFSKWKNKIKIERLVNVKEEFLNYNNYCL